jgi:hypothetical protein
MTSLSRGSSSIKKIENPRRVRVNPPYNVAVLLGLTEPLLRTAHAADRPRIPIPSTFPDWSPWPSDPLDCLETPKTAVLFWLICEAKPANSLLYHAFSKLPENEIAIRVI